MLAGRAKVNIDEFTAECGKVTAPSSDEVLEAFSTFDMHGNGFIALDELVGVMQNLGEGLKPKELDGMKAACGADAENHVNILHFVDVTSSFKKQFYKFTVTLLYSVVERCASITVSVIRIKSNACVEL